MSKIIIKNRMRNTINTPNTLPAEVYSELSETSEKELFAKIVNG